MSAISKIKVGETTYDASGIEDVKVDGSSIVTNKVANFSLANKQDVISDLETIRSGAEAGATAVQPQTGKGLFSGNYNDLSNKLTAGDHATITSDNVINVDLGRQIYVSTSQEIVSGMQEGDLLIVYEA